jgi:hypothetical protein
MTLECGLAVWEIFVDWATSLWVFWPTAVSILRCIICRGNFMSAAIFGVDGGVFLIVRARATTATVAAFSAFLPRIALSLKTLSRY